MENKKPTIYVLAGPNGIGKTTVNPFFIPSGVTYINADDIAKQLKEKYQNINVQELANAQALEQMNKFIISRQDFAIETNLADNDTWKFLENIQLLGYSVQLNFFCTDNINICINRIAMRVLQGGHFVRTDIVHLRYEAGLKLLKYYKGVPDKLLLTDNTSGLSRNCAELNKGELVSIDKENLPIWISNLLSLQIDKKDNFQDLDEVREKYRKMKETQNNSNNETI